MRYLFRGNSRRGTAAVRHKFGLGEGQTPPNLEMLALVNRSIKRLADDLYAKDVHFILEVRICLARGVGFPHPSRN